MKGKTASLTAWYLGISSLVKLISSNVAPCINCVAILATGFPIALDTKGIVLEALGLASKINNSFPSLFKFLTANCKLIKPTTFNLFAINFVHFFTVSIVFWDKEIEGKQQAESPEWIPAGSTCSISPAITIEPVTSHNASTSISIALLKYWSKRIGWSGETLTASEI